MAFIVEKSLIGVIIKYKMSQPIKNQLRKYN